jgi:hypothetical protein
MVNPGLKALVTWVVTPAVLPAPYVAWLLIPGGL